MTEIWFVKSEGSPTLMTLKYNLLKKMLEALLQSQQTGARLARWTGRLWPRMSWRDKKWGKWRSFSELPRAPCVVTLPLGRQALEGTACHGRPSTAANVTHAVASRTSVSCYFDCLIYKVNFMIIGSDLTSINSCGYLNLYMLTCTKRLFIRKEKKILETSWSF